MIITCTCSHDYQDKVYGKGRRVANKMKGVSKDSKKARCTSCGSIKG